MFRRKLKALGHPSAESLDPDDPKDLKILALWLEDQKIRHYSIEDRAGLHSHEGAEWKKTFLQYLRDLECPFTFDSQPCSVIDWLLGVAVRYEYQDISREHSELRYGLSVTKGSPSPLLLTKSGKSALDIDPSDITFTAGVKALANVVRVTQHHDSSVLLEAVMIAIRTNLSLEAVKSIQPKGTKGTKKFNVTAKDCGLDLGDPVLSEAAKLLRLLHIQELRHLQTCINELIVAVQALTADPKTDQSLGRVGK
jgi:RLL motif-containing protein 1